ncbi:MAG TPA: hypothetical protein VF518_13210, partial [Polyangia bacterium]
MSAISIPSCRRLAGAVVALFCLACASKPPSGGPGAYRGVIVSASEIGIIDLTVGEAASGPFPASGSIRYTARTVALSGTLDRSQTAISLASAEGLKLEGESRPKYMFGSFQGPAGATDRGSFALLLEPSDGIPVQLYCGSYTFTSSTTSPLPFAVTAVAPGSAICVGADFAWFGSLDPSGYLSCAISGGIYQGDVNADAGNPWGTGQNYGNWTVTPCGAASLDGGVDDANTPGPDTSADGSAAEASPVDAGVDSPV